MESHSSHMHNRKPLISHMTDNHTTHSHAGPIVIHTTQSRLTQTHGEASAHQEYTNSFQLWILDLFHTLWTPTWDSEPRRNIAPHYMTQTLISHRSPLPRQAYLLFQQHSHDPLNYPIRKRLVLAGTNHSAKWARTKGLIAWGAETMLKGWPIRERPRNE